jgi:hypothetical protein
MSGSLIETEHSPGYIGIRPEQTVTAQGVQRWELQQTRGFSIRPRRSGRGGRRFESCHSDHAPQGFPGLFNFAVHLFALVFAREPGFWPIRLVAMSPWKSGW